MLVQFLIVINKPDMRLSTFVGAAQTLAIACAIALPSKPVDSSVQPVALAKPPSVATANAQGLANIMAFLLTNNKDAANNNMPMTPGNVGAPVISTATQPTATSQSSGPPAPGAVAQAGLKGTSAQGPIKAAPTPTATGLNNTIAPSAPVSPTAPLTPASNTPYSQSVNGSAPAAGPVAVAPVAAYGNMSSTAPSTTAPASNTTRITSGSISDTASVDTARLSKRNGDPRQYAKAPVVNNGPRPNNGQFPAGAKLPPGLIGMTLDRQKVSPHKRSLAGLTNDTDSADYGMESLETAIATPVEDLQPVLTSSAMDDEDSQTSHQVYDDVDNDEEGTTVVASAQDTSDRSTFDQASANGTATPNSASTPGANPYGAAGASGTAGAGPSYADMSSSGGQIEIDAVNRAKTNYTMSPTGSSVSSGQAPSPVPAPTNSPTSSGTMSAGASSSGMLGAIAANGTTASRSASVRLNLSGCTLLLSMGLSLTFF